jgi:hypothetical protein
VILPLRNPLTKPMIGARRAEGRPANLRVGPQLCFTLLPRAYPGCRFRAWYLAGRNPRSRIRSSVLIPVPCGVPIGNQRRPAQLMQPTREVPLILRRSSKTHAESREHNEKRPGEHAARRGDPPPGTTRTQEPDNRAQASGRRCGVVAGTPNRPLIRVAKVESTLRVGKGRPPPRPRRRP